MHEQRDHREITHTANYNILVVLHVVVQLPYLKFSALFQTLLLHYALKSRA